MTRVVLGTMRTSGNFNGLMVVDRDTDSSSGILHAAMADPGIHGFDTAPIYARGLAESDLGRWCPDAPVWTKVGVDVSTPLPTLDYSLPTMTRTLDASCERLRRPSVECVFVHNPPMDVFQGLDWRELKEALVDRGAADQLGVSVLDPSEIALVAEVDTPLTVMVETQILESSPHLAGRLHDAGHRLVLRSLFAGGRGIRSVPTKERADAVTSRLVGLVERFDPWAVVMAPRTPAQLADYAPAVARLRQAVGQR
ncbi:aldo/keto reductase [Streptomyces coerulescens]|uniref:Aldo/keto reductase n=1 Tax=Streptomyces coerulescens TaxID=29304 RepID=A0ABW0CVC1_STRCD